MATPVAFESTWKKKELKEQIQEQRERYIEKLKAKHEREEWKKEQAHLRGEDTWMLDSVTERLDEEQKVLDKAMKKKKKVKKHKKEKKHKRKKKKNDNSASESNSDVGEGMWTEKPTSNTKPCVVKGCSLQRESWMMEPSSDFGQLPSITKTEFNEQRQKKKDEDRGMNENIKQMSEEPGQHERELNPYWKDGGTGLPEKDSNRKKTKILSADITAGDGGVGWWQRAYQCCVDLAKEEGRPLEEVAADRYGSLKNLEAMLSAAVKNEKKIRTYRQQSGNSRFRKPGIDDERTEYKRKYSDRQEAHCSSSPKWKKKGFLKPGKQSHETPEQREKKRKPMETTEDGDESYPKRRHNYDEHRSVPQCKEESQGKSSCSENRRTESSKRDDNRKNRHHTGSKDSRYESRYKQADEREKNLGREMDRHENRRNKTELERNHKGKDNIKKQSESYSSSGSSSVGEASSSSSDSDSEPESEPSERSAPTPKILTEQELNELGARMVKAELMGNVELATKIKAEIKQCREAKELHAKSHSPSETMERTKRKNDEEVVLTMTDRYGNVRPLPAREHADSSRRRCKEKVKTHSLGGSRERYFHDDDNKDLRSLVEQERLGTAEDSNYQFLKLAGKAFGGRQGLEDMDEVFMEGASEKISGAKLELKERSQAIAEHRKMSAAIEKCQYCFDKVPKHLIIAIGLKVYLCLPNHRSMTEGHCLIVPMQHLKQSTCIDEDVFEEIQVFRRALTKMYEMHDLDCVFMETCKDLHRHPHMVIECVPLPRELGDVAAIYFKKAIQESESEWSQNKKVVDLSKKNIRSAIPKGFPYFAVNFGLQGGFAHVIEEEKSFPYYFGREILGGMLDLEPLLWRRPHKESFDEQRKKVLAFADWWKPVDWTKKLKSAIDSD